MPIYNRFFFDVDPAVGTAAGKLAEAAARLNAEGPTVPILVNLPADLVAALRKEGHSVPDGISGQALLDTGSDSFAVDSSVVEHLGSKPVDSLRVKGAVGPAMEQLVHPFSLSFPTTNLPALPIAFCVSLPLKELGIVAVLGRQLLKKYALIYNGPAGHITIAG